MNESKSEWFFIVNPHAGSGKTMCQWVPVEQKLYKLGLQFTTAYTDHKRHAMALAYGAADEGYRKILAVGGDGSVHEAFNGIMQWCDAHGASPEEFTLCVAPIGSGNDWLKSLEAPRDIDKVADALIEGVFGRMDVVRIDCKSDYDTTKDEVHYMANIGGIGFDSHVCERVNRQKERGKRNKVIYLNGLQYTVRHLKPIRLQVLADGEEVFSGECLSIALGNGKFSGGGMQQVPLAKIDDGILDAMIVPKIPLKTIIKEAPKLFSGDIDKSVYLKTVQCRQLQIIPLDDASRDIIELDGEIIGRLPATVSITGRQISVIRGKSSKQD